MKRSLLGLLAGLALVSFAHRTVAQSAEAAIAAMQRDAEERYRRLNADVQNAVETQEVIQRQQEQLRQRLDRIESEIRSLKDEQGRNSGNLVTQEQLRKYVEKLKEIDDKREADKKLILENIRELAKIPPAPNPETPKRTPKRDPDAAASDDPAYVYTIKKNDRLLDIVAGYNEQFKKEGRGKTTMDQVLKANPGLKPERLIAGKKIQIPIPPKEK